MLILLYTAAIFLGAFLLFLVQPMAAKAVLPLLGGSPSVWNTCMVFFQAALLAGYAYAHGLLRIRRPAFGVAIHAALVLGAASMLPLALRQPGIAPDSSFPVGWLLGVLLLSVGGPFFIVSTTGPLLQGWFSRTGHRASGDPYFLYAASNAGSMLALLAYPLLVEPFLTLHQQEYVWSGAYAAFALAVLACGVVALRRGGVAPLQAAPHGPRSVLGWPTRARWVLMAFIPSSLMLGVTLYISTDIAPVPLLWVLPLAIYLLSFILVFGRRRLVPAWAWSWAMTILVVALSVAFLRGAREPAVLLIVLHLLALLAGSMICHGRLAAERPHADRLTEFYLLIAVGGVLGGLFNAIVAPMVFTSVAEYPLVLALACLFRSPRHAPEAVSTPTRRESGRWERLAGLWDGWGPRSAVALDVAWAAALVGVYWLLEFIAAATEPGSVPGDIELLLTIGLPIGVPLFLCYLYSRRNLRFALGLGALLVFAQSYGAQTGLRVRIIHAERTFFGAYRVEEEKVEVLNSLDLPEVDPATGRIKEDVYHALFHGTTLHGQQNLSNRGMPMWYYHPKGPIGQAMEALKGDPRVNSIGLVGLGTGAIAAYAGAGQKLTFFEIDPAVVRIASDPALFTFLADCRARGGAIEERIGDGRLSMGKEPDGTFGMIVLDAFSSDAIPVHLITLEAIELYLAKLAPGGVLAFHISNRHLDLEPVLAAAEGALGMEGLIEDELVTDPEELGKGRSPSTWVVLARSRKDLDFLSRDARWRPLLAEKGFRVWTDDFSNIWGIFR